MALKSWSIASFPWTSLVREGEALWTQVGETSEYYCTLPISGSPKPKALRINGTLAEEGVVGSLTEGTWGYYDGDIYAYITGGTDPDNEDPGYITAFFGTAELLDSGTGTILVLSLLASNYSAEAGANIVFERQGSDAAMKFRWVLPVPIGNSPVALDSKMVFTNGDKLVVISDAEEVSIEASGDES